MTYVKRQPGAPPGFFAAEAAGLRWLREGSPAVVEVIGHGEDWIELAELARTAPSAAMAEQLGRDLAALHATGSPAFGFTPQAGPAFIGRQEMPSEPTASWSRMYVEQRVLPYVVKARDRGHISPGTQHLVEKACGAISDDGCPPARIHGDLWNGNVVWTPTGAVLIDPAAHGGHRETDLAMLQLFGVAFAERILTAYDEAAPLRDGWRLRVPQHQLHPLAVHAASHGGSYEAPLRDAALRSR